MELEEKKKRKKGKENRKNTILRAARRLFFDRGFKAVTVDNIATKSENQQRINLPLLRE